MFFIFISTPETAQKLCVDLLHRYGGWGQEQKNDQGKNRVLFFSFASLFHGFHVLECLLQAVKAQASEQQKKKCTYYAACKILTSVPH